MSKVVHPYAHRLVTLRDWKSRWFGDKNYKDLLQGDVVIREFLAKKLRGFYVSRIEIERSAKATKIMVHTSRPGMIIGRSGEGVTKIKSEMVKALHRKKIEMPEDFKFDIVEVTNPDADAAIVACSIAEALEKRLPYRRVMKQAIDKIMSARGVKRMLPGAADAMQGDALSKGEREMRRMEGIICSMTPHERRNPAILNAKRRQRIAKGSGTQVSEVNNVLNRFAQMQQMMKKMGKLQKMMAKMGGGGMPGLGGLGGLGGMGGMGGLGGGGGGGGFRGR